MSFLCALLKGGEEAKMAKQDVVKLATEKQRFNGMKSCLPFFAVGNPEEGIVSLGLAKALGCYLNHNYKVDDEEGLRAREANLGTNPGIYSAGTRTNEAGSEDLYVEYSESEEADEIQCIRIDRNGKLTACVYHQSTKSFTSKLKTKDDCAGAWLALLIKTILDVNTNIDGVVNSNIYATSLDASLNAINNGLISAHPEQKSIVEKEALETVQELIKRYAEDGLKEFDKTSILELGSVELQNGTLGPQKHLHGVPFRAMKKCKESKKELVLDTKRYQSIAWVNNDLSPQELALVPKDNKRHVVSQLEVEILDEIERTSKKSADMRVTNILLSGTAGTGKSETARFIASEKALKRPFVTQTCDADMTKDDLLGCLMPVVSDDAETIKSLTKDETEVYLAIKDTEGGSRESAIDAFAETLGYPTIAECFLDPIGSWEILTGTKTTDIDPASCVEKLDSLMSNILTTVIEKLSNGSDKAVSYRYIPSPTIEAIKNGYVLELQEPTNVKNQGIFSCLYDVLEKASIGTVQTPLGRIKRHDDFVCIMTTNTSYTGNRPLSPAFESRFSFNKDIDNLDSQTLFQRVKAKVGEEMTSKNITLLQKAVDVFEKVKEIGADNSVRGDLTPRALYSFCDAICDGISPKVAFHNYILHHLSHERDDKDTIWEAIQDHDLFTGTM